MIDGVYTDPLHAIPMSFGGLRAIATRGAQVVVVGCDDGDNWWTLFGTIGGEDVEIDFGPKAPKVGLLKATATATKLTFTDGNAWEKLQLTDVFQPSKKDGLGLFRSAGGLRFISNHLGKTPRDDVAVVTAEPSFSAGTFVDGTLNVPGLLTNANLKDGVILHGDEVWTKLDVLHLDPHALPRVVL